MEEKRTWKGEGGHTKMAHKLNDVPAKELSSTSKLVYLILCYHQRKAQHFSPSIQMMLECYGIGRKAYDKAKSQLVDLEFIEVEKIGNGLRDQITITSIGDLGNFEEIPNALIVTPTLTPTQKIFMAFLYKEIYRNPEDRRKIIHYSGNKIHNELKGKGFSRPVIHRCLKELSDTKEGFVTLLYKSGDSYEINLHAIFALYDFEPELHKRFKYPVYKKVTAGMYSYDFNKNKIITNIQNQQKPEPESAKQKTPMENYEEMKREERREARKAKREQPKPQPARPKSENQAQIRKYVDRINRLTKQKSDIQHSIKWAENDVKEAGMIKIAELGKQIEGCFNAINKLKKEANV